MNFTDKEKTYLRDGLQFLINNKMQQIDNSRYQAAGYERFRYIKERIDAIDEIIKLKLELQ